MLIEAVPHVHVRTALLITVRLVDDVVAVEYGSAGNPRYVEHQFSSRTKALAWLTAVLDALGAEGVPTTPVR